MRPGAQFYREVLDPVDVKRVSTSITSVPESRVRFGVEGARTNRLISEIDGHIAYLREFTPNALLAAMDNALAKAIVEKHLWRGVNQVLSAKSEADYTKKSRNLLARYCKEGGLEFFGELSPVVAVSCLFQDSRTLASESWHAYRSALLFAFRKVRAQQIRRGEGYAAYDRAIAILVIVNKPPHSDERQGQEKHKPRDGIPAGDLAALCKHLQASTVNRSSETRTFLMAIVETGLRPCEWSHVEYVVSDVEEKKGHQTLLVRTAKNKGPLVRSRTLVLRTPEVQALVEEQLRNVRSEIASAAYDAVIPALDNLTKKCSARLKAAGKELWPHHPKRWPTLYVARHQARANFAQAFDEETAAAMLGHGFEVSCKHYAPRRRGAAGSLKASVGPGADVINRANEMRAKYVDRKPANRPWERKKPVDDEEAPRPN